MKKTIVIIILAVYIASIAIVNFFGIEAVVFDGVTYVSTIQCNSVFFEGDNSKEIFPIYADDGITPIFIFDFIPAAEGNQYTSETESIISNPNVIRLNYEIMPHLADEAGIKFEYDEEAGVAVFHELSTSFVILKPNKLFTVNIKATDGSNKSTRVQIMGRLPE